MSNFNKRIERAIKTANIDYEVSERYQKLISGWHTQCDLDNAESAHNQAILSAEFALDMGAKPSTLEYYC